MQFRTSRWGRFLRHPHPTALTSVSCIDLIFVFVWNVATWRCGFEIFWFKLSKSLYQNILYYHQERCSTKNCLRGVKMFPNFILRKILCGLTLALDVNTRLILENKKPVDYVVYKLFRFYIAIRNCLRSLIYWLRDNRVTCFAIIIFRRFFQTFMCFHRSISVHRVCSITFHLI